MNEPGREPLYLGRAVAILHNIRDMVDGSLDAETTIQALRAYLGALLAEDEGT